MKILKNLLILVTALLLGLFLSTAFGNWYGILFHSGSWVDLSSMIGFPLAYTFFLPLLFTAFGGKRKYWWVGIGLIPALWFEISFDPYHLYFPLALGILGWLIGFGIHKLIQSRSGK